MATTIKTVKSAEMVGRVRFLKWKAKWERDFIAPVGRMLLRERVMMLTGEQLRAWQARDPEGFRAAMEEIKRQ